MHISNTDIDERLSGDIKEYGATYYYVGIAIAFTSTAMDMFTNFVIRSIGYQMPGVLVPYVMGLVSTVFNLVYSLIWEPFDITFKTTSSDYIMGIGFAIIGGLMGFLAILSLTHGLAITKSALASYGEMSGIIVPFFVDCFYFDRQFLAIDAIACSIIISVQIFQAYKSIQKKGKDISEGEGQN